MKKLGVDCAKHCPVSSCAGNGHALASLHPYATWTCPLSPGRWALDGRFSSWWIECRSKWRYQIFIYFEIMAFWKSFYFSGIVWGDLFCPAIYTMLLLVIEVWIAVLRGMFWERLAQVSRLILGCPSPSNHWIRTRLSIQSLITANKAEDCACKSMNRIYL